MFELNLIKYLQLPAPAAFAVVGGFLLYAAASNPSIFVPYVLFAFICFSFGAYLYRCAVDDTNRTLISVEKERTRQAEIRQSSRIQEAQNIQLRRQAESEKTIHKGLRKLID